MKVPTTTKPSTEADALDTSDLNLFLDETDISQSDSSSYDGIASTDFFENLLDESLLESVESMESGRLELENEIGEQMVDDLILKDGGNELNQINSLRMPDVTAMKEESDTMPMQLFENTLLIPGTMVPVAPLMGTVETRQVPPILPDSESNKRAKLSRNNAIERKMTKREIRLMKNRESANRSRLRKKGQAQEIQKKLDAAKQEIVDLKTQAAALQAENTSLKEQNGFLKQLLTSKDTIAPQQMEQVVVNNMTIGTRKNLQGGKLQTIGPVASAMLCSCALGVAAITKSMNQYAGTLSPSVRHTARVLQSHDPNASNITSKYSLSTTQDALVSLLLILALLSVLVLGGVILKSVLVGKCSYKSSPIAETLPTTETGVDKPKNSSLRRRLCMRLESFRLCKCAEI